MVRLQDLHDEGARWLVETFLLTREVRDHLQALTRLFRGDSGGGCFLIGHYGSGKSHFLAYLALQLRAGALLPESPDCAVISLVNFSAANRLEDIVCGALGLAAAAGDRRPAWDEMLRAHARGLVILIDELSEFLRAKADAHSFSEDVRFLQFLGEWAQDRRCWIVAAMQEGIEHTGELEYGLYRKIKDRYPLRLLLTPAHVQALIADSILIKKPGYAEAVEALSRELRGATAENAVDFGVLQAVYPVHPATLQLLEEVRDRFSQARGVVDFAVTRLLGDATRGIEPFLEQPFGSLVTPDAIVDHFRDLFEVQPEFLPLAQQVFPWYAKHLGELFDKPALRALAERVLKLLVLVHLSPARETLSPAEAAAWLLLSAARIDPERNRTVIEKVLATLAARGRYVVGDAGRYRLELRDDSAAALEQLLAREVPALEGQETLVFETLVPLLPPRGFNPFQPERDAWQHRRVAWHFHERRYAVWLGDGMPAALEGLGLCVRLPWGEAAAAPGVFTIAPAPLRLTRDLVELAALVRLRERPHGPELAQRIQQRLDARAPLVQQAIRSAWQEARLITPEGTVEAAPRVEAQATFEAWLDTVALVALRRIYPAFERCAPVHGPLPKEAWVRFMRFAATEDIGVPLADEYVRLIREAYLVPMGLLRRKGQEYTTPPNLERHELVRLLAPLLEHSPPPRVIHEHLAQPIYGLVPDQVNLLLVFLLLQGEIDILKDRKSYRETFETLPDPLQYDRLVPGHALSAAALAGLEHLCRGLGIATPAHWSVLTQRRCAGQLAESGRRHVERLQPLVRRLAGLEQGGALAADLQRHIDRWSTLDAGGHALHGLEQFLFEIGSPSGFLEEIAAYRELPARIERLLSETQRYAHLLGHPAVRRFRAEEVEALGAAPGLHEPQALERWLDRAARLYDAYKLAYRERHEAWWQALAAHAIWTWTSPPLARSRHVDGAELLAAIEGCRRDAERQRCRGLVNLDYQPHCTCGFDGEGSPIAALLDQFDQLVAAVDTRLRLFFQQDRVKTRLRTWQQQGIEMQAGTLAYLDGQCSTPEVRELAAFDDFLDGVDLASEVDVASVLELLEKRLWPPAELLEELRRLLAAPGAQRLRFTGGRGHEMPPAVLEWCAEQSLRHGVPLPAGFTRAESRVLAAALRSEWMSAAALRRLEQLGLDDTGVDRVLAWVLEGQVALPDGGWAGDSALAAVASLLRPPPIETPAQLAAASGCLYRAHDRLQRLSRQRWLSHLDAVAGTALGSVPLLVDVLRQHLEAQWVLIDCLGLALTDAVAPVVHETLGAWRPEPPRFAEVSTPSTTDACYRALLAAGIEHPIEKIDAVDALIHDEPVPFAELAALARAKLDSACRRLAARLDPARPLLVFADHGFRLAADGRRYTHGGASTLERIVPVWRFTPRAG